MSSYPKFLIIGMGPIGLLMAHKLLSIHKYPNSHVTIIDIRYPYSRKQILMLKSAFSVIDQMFFQEIENGELFRQRWFCAWCWWYKFFLWG